MPIWLIPLLLAGLGTAAQVKQSRDVQNDQQAALNLADQRAQERRKAALATILGGAEQYNPATRAQKLQQTEDTTASTLSNALQQAAGDRAIGSVAQDTGGKVSTTYDAAKASAEAGQTRQAVNLAKLMAKFGGQQRLRQGEAINTAGAATNADTDLSAARNYLNAGQRAAGMIRPAEVPAILASALQSYGFGSMLTPEGAPQVSAGDKQLLAATRGKPITMGIY